MQRIPDAPVHGAGGVLPQGVDDNPLPQYGDVDQDVDDGVLPAPGVHVNGAVYGNVDQDGDRGVLPAPGVDANGVVIQAANGADQTQPPPKPPRLNANIVNGATRGIRSVNTTILEEEDEQDEVVPHVDPTVKQMETSIDSLEDGAVGGIPHNALGNIVAHVDGEIINIDEMIHDELSDYVPGGEGEEDQNRDVDPFNDAAFMAKMKSDAKGYETDLVEADSDAENSLTLMGRFKTLRRKSRARKEPV